ncbi:hypothetical protein [Hydrogenoanaerobacterium saccharovorans]|nr:hypothetical protein [Hydrogenoanaerobacterium saccharovorans]
MFKQSSTNENLYNGRYFKMGLFTGGIAFIIAIINLILVFTGKHKHCNILAFLSLSSGLLAMLSEYVLINGWVQAGDISALMDVVPTMNNILITAVCIGVVFNAIAVFVNYKKLKK